MLIFFVVVILFETKTNFTRYKKEMYEREGLIYDANLNDPKASMSFGRSL